MNRTTCIALVALATCCGYGHCASDGFSAVKCGADIPGSLIGKAMPNERVAVLEGRHKDLGLHDLGGTEISDDLFLASWNICGEEFELLEKKETVRDVLKAPAHSKSSPLFIGACQQAGGPVPGTVLAVLDNKPGIEMLAANKAWKIDEQAHKFVALSTQGLACPRDGIVTSDGGR
jgi:hypothetical protein